MEFGTSILTKNSGLLAIENVACDTEVLCWDEKKLTFSPADRSRCEQTNSDEMVRFTTDSGNLFVVAANQQFMVWVEGGVGEVVPSYLLEPGTKLFAASKSGHIVDDEVVDIGPATGETYTDCELVCPPGFHPLFFAGGLGIVSH